MGDLRRKKLSQPPLQKKQKTTPIQPPGRRRRVVSRRRGHTVGPLASGSRQGARKEREREGKGEACPSEQLSHILLKTNQKSNQGLLSRLWQLSVLACAVLGAAVFHEPWSRALISSLRNLMGRGSSKSSVSSNNSGVRVGFSSCPSKGT